MDNVVVFVLLDELVAIEAAVEKRKFLIKRLLKDYSFTEDMQR